MTAHELTFRPPAGLTRVFQVLALVGGITLGLGLFLMPDRTWVNVLLVSYYLIGLGLGGLVFVALLYITGARWSDSLRPVPVAMTWILPVAAVGLAAVLLCRPSLYPWSDPSTFEPESPLQHLWLSRPFFLVRSAVYLVLWLAFAAALRRNIKLSAAFLVVFGITCWLASYDWIMSLEPRWTSTIFGVYNFAGIFLSGLAALTLLLVALRGHTVFDKKHFHDIGTLLFSFSCFWMYTWFCQYMLIWYVNNPEETAYLRARWQGTWPGIMFLDIGLNWAIPFVVLLFRSAKCSPLVLGTVATIILAGRWVDLALMIEPSQRSAVSVPGLLEIGLFVGSIALFALAVLRGLGKVSPIPQLQPK
jgi:hypothetical protein